MLKYSAKSWLLEMLAVMQGLLISFTNSGRFLAGLLCLVLLTLSLGLHPVVAMNEVKCSNVTLVFDFDSDTDASIHVSVCDTDMEYDIADVFIHRETFITAAWPSWASARAPPYL